MIVKENPQRVNEISFEQRERELKEDERKEKKEQEKLKKGPFRSFYQVNKENSEYLSSCLKESPKALELLLFIFEKMDKYNALTCSYTTFSEALGMSKATIQRSVKYLKDNGFLFVYKIGTGNVYVANNNLVWSSWGSNAKYCEFPSNTILSKKEQEIRTKTHTKKLTSIKTQ